MQGKVHIYCGSGKGKTTAAIGLSIRACGSGYQVLFTQFLKSGKTGELDILNSIDGITVLRTTKHKKFMYLMSDEEKKVLSANNNALFKTAISLIRDEKTLLVLDEILDAVNNNAIDKNMVMGFLRERPDIEIVMTGRAPCQELLDIADYVSEVQKVKHPYDNGIAARKGIEY